MSVIAVTGASGFIGQRLIERLCRDGVSVRALMRKRPVQAATEGGDVTIIKGSLGDDAALSAVLDGADAVVHLAGLIKARSREAFFAANTDSVHHLAGLIKDQANPPKLILASSLAARQPTLSSYAESKRRAEDALSAPGNAFPWTILRPPAVYGPGDRETLSFFKGIKSGVGAMLGDDHARFSLLHVDDLVTLILEVLDPTIADRQTLEPDDGLEGGHSWRGMVATAEQAFGKTVFRLRVPKTILSVLGYTNAGLRILPGYTPMLTREKVRELTHPDWVADRRSIFDTTDWKPEIPADRGFSATINWYRLHNWL